MGRVGRCVLVGGLAIVTASAFARQDDALPVVVPTPQQMVWGDAKGAAWLAGEVCRRIVIVAEPAASTRAAVEQLNARLAALKRPALPCAVGQADGGGRGTIVLGVEPCPPLDKRLCDLPRPKGQGYRLAVGPAGVVVLGRDAAGLYYGVMTLRQLIQPDGRIPRVAIADWPDLPVRGTYIAGHHYGPTPEKKIPYFASLKLNLVLFEYNEFYHLDDEKIRRRWQETFALCRRHGIEPVPELQSLGWGHFVLSLEPRCVEGVTCRDQPFVVRDGKIVPVTPKPGPVVPLVNPGFEQANGDDATGWGQDAVGGAIRVDKTEKHAGSASLRIDMAQRGMMRAWQDVACRPNQGYEVRCWLKTRNVSGSGGIGAYIEVYGLHANGSLGTLLVKAEGRGGSADWRIQAARFKSGQYGRVRIYVRIQDASGTAWFDDVVLKGALVDVPDGLGNVVITEASLLVVTDATGKVTYTRNEDYRIVPGDPLVGPGPGMKRTSFPDDAKPMTLAVVPGGRINPSDKLRVTFTHAPQGSVTCCPSEPLYQEIMRKSIHNVIRYLQPKIIHIGHDEPRVLNRDDRCKRRGLTNTELFVDDIKRMREFARQADPNVRLMMWADAVNPHHNEPHAGMKQAAKRLPRDIILCPWFYTSPQNNEVIDKSVAYFTGLGFDTTGSPWFGFENAHYWAVCLHRHHRRTPHALGGIYTSWKDGIKTDPWQALTTYAEYLWSANKPSFAEWMARRAK